MHINGGCHCGDITYEAEIDPDKVFICHCIDCQIISGAPYRTVVGTSEGNFKLLSGEIKTYIKTAESGNLREQNFCPECGSHIYATSVGEGDRIFGIRLGTVQQRNELTPNKQLYFNSAQTWVEDLSHIEKA